MLSILRRHRCVPYQFPLLLTQWNSTYYIHAQIRLTVGNYVHSVCLEEILPGTNSVRTGALPFEDRCPFGPSWIHLLHTYTKCSSQSQWGFQAGRPHTSKIDIFFDAFARLDNDIMRLYCQSMPIETWFQDWHGVSLYYSPRPTRQSQIMKTYSWEVHVFNGQYQCPYLYRNRSEICTIYFYVGYEECEVQKEKTDKILWCVLGLVLLWFGTSRVYPDISWWPSTSNISHTLVGNTLVDHSDVVGASPVGAAPTTSSFST